MTNRIATVALVVLSVAVVALAGTTMSLRGRVAELESHAAAAPPRAPAPRAFARDFDDDEDLDDRLAALEARPPAAARFTPPAPRARDDDAEASDATASAGADTPVAREVRAAVRQELDRAEEEKSQAREERLRARMRERIDKLAADAKLTAEEKVKVESLLDAELVEMRQLMRDARESMDWGSMREQLRTMREKTDENVKAILDDDDKLEVYDDMRKEERARALGMGRDERRNRDRNNNESER